MAYALVLGTRLLLVRIQLGVLKGLSNLSRAKAISIGVVLRVSTQKTRFNEASKMRGK